VWQVFIKFPTIFHKFLWDGSDNYALTPARVQAHYNIGLYGTTNVPPIVEVPAAPVTVNLDGDGSIISTIVDGPGPFTYEWYYVASGVTNDITGATTGTLALTDIQGIQVNYQYYVVVSNAYGAATSAPITLNIVSGAPVLVADITPLLNYVPVGQSISFSVGPIGTAPFSYQWSTQSGPITGATNSSYSFDALGGSNNYSVAISNSLGVAASSTAIVVGLTNPPPIIGFNGNGTNWTFNQGAGWAGLPHDPNITDGVLTLTDGFNSETCSAFFDTPQDINAFTVSFTYQEAPGNAPLADGITFCIQNDTTAPYTLGGGGGGLGVTTISPSAALEINIYSGDHAGPWICFGTNGLVPDTGLTNYFDVPPVNLASGDPILVQFSYEQGVGTLVLSDAAAQATNTTAGLILEFTTNIITGDLPTIVGGNTAYIGFTGGDGALNAIQKVSNLAFQSFSATAPSSPVLSIVRGIAGSVIISWPTSASPSFVLQEATSLKGPWSPVGTAPVIVGSENEVTLTPGVTTFYKLLMP